MKKLKKILKNGPKDFNGYLDLLIHTFTSSCGEFNAKVFENGITLATNFGQHIFLDFRDVIILKKRLEMCLNYLLKDNVYIYPWLYISYHQSRVFSICRHYKKKQIIKRFNFYDADIEIVIQLLKESLQITKPSASINKNN